MGTQFIFSASGSLEGNPETKLCPKGEYKQALEETVFGHVWSNTHYNQAYTTMHKKNRNMLSQYVDRTSA